MGLEDKTGRIVKGIAGFYYVNTEYSRIYECKAKGAFRNQSIKPLVGDYVRIQVTDEEKQLGHIEEILPRENELIRPAVANVDQALVIFAATYPEPNLNLLDRYLVMMEYEDLPAVIVFNKIDLCENGEAENLRSIYESIGYRVILTSVKRGLGISELKAALSGKTSTVAGPSGVGKSSLTNELQPHIVMETGDISTKIERGRNTTRHSQLILINQDTYLMDTPGFSSLNVPDISKEELNFYFPEFTEPSQACRFQGCTHIHEPDCGVKAALNDGGIAKSRYENYLLMYEEVKNRRKY